MAWGMELGDELADVVDIQHQDKVAGGFD